MADMTPSPAAEVQAKAEDKRKTIIKWVVIAVVIAVVGWLVYKYVL